MHNGEKLAKGTQTNRNRTQKAKPNLNIHLTYIKCSRPIH